MNIVINTTYKDYLKKFNNLYYNIIEPVERFKVDPAPCNKNISYYICNKGAAAVELVTFNTVIIKGLIAYNGGGSTLLKHIINLYASRFNIKLDTFSSNYNFYKKNGFIIEYTSQYNKKYDPDGLNINKEPVLYMVYKPAAV